MCGGEEKDKVSGWLAYFEVFVIIEEMKKRNLWQEAAVAERAANKKDQRSTISVDDQASREREKEAFSSRAHKHFWLLPLIGMSCWPGPWWGVGHISLHWTSYSCVVFCLVTFDPHPPARHLPIRLARHFYERKDFNKINTSFGRWCGAKRAQKVLARSSFFLLSAMGDQLFLSPSFRADNSFS